MLQVTVFIMVLVCLSMFGQGLLLSLDVMFTVFSFVIVGLGVIVGLLFTIPYVLQGLGVM